MADPTTTTPINPSRFRDALQPLPIDALHAKAAELLTSLLKLRESNSAMLPFAEAGDADCREAMFENLGVIGRMKERLDMVKEEVEGRGVRWVFGDEMDRMQPSGQRGTVDADGESIVVNTSALSNGAVNGNTNEIPNGSGTRQASGRLTDEQLRAQLEAQMNDEEDADGVHL